MNILKETRPPGWTKPQLPMFFETVWANTLATFANKPESHRLCRIDDVMFEIATDWKGIAPTVENMAPLMMFFRAHSAFRAGCSVGMGGMTVEGMAVLRLSLEFAGYACLLKESPSLAMVWWDRDVDEKTLKEARRQLTGSAVAKAVKKMDSRLGEIYEMLYDRTIQFGGHPNEKTVTQSLKMHNTPEETRIDQIYLQGDATILDHWIRTANQIGICVLKLFERVHHERFERLNVKARIATLSEGL